MTGRRASDRPPVMEYRLLAVAERAAELITGSPAGGSAARPR